MWTPLERGKHAAATIDKLVEPSAVFIGGGYKKLYALEDQRTEIIRKCAHEWARIQSISEKEFWTRSLPQALFDTLEKYETQCAAIAAEAYLKQLGWKVERPK